MSRIRKKDLTKYFNLILLLITLGLMTYFCISDSNLVTLVNSVPNLNMFWLAISVLSMFIYWLLDAKIIHNITSSIYKDKYKFKSAFKVSMVGQYFNSITPLAIAGQPMQILTMVRQGISAGVAFSISVQKFLVYQTSLTIYSLLVIVFKYGYFRSHFPKFISLALVGFLIQSFIVVLLLLFSLNREFTTKLLKLTFKLLEKVHIVKNAKEKSKKIEQQLNYYICNNRAMNKNHRLALKLYLSTFLQLTAYYIIPFCLYKAFHSPGFPVIDMISAQAFVTMISSYTPLPGGAGTSEGSFLTIFNIFFDSEITKQAMLLWRFIAYYSCILVGSLFAGFAAKQEKINIDEIMNENIKNIE